jgi:hypothetical protein
VFESVGVKPRAGKASSDHPHHPVSLGSSDTYIKYLTYVEVWGRIGLL